jgi:hypothetical protein
LASLPIKPTKAIVTFNILAITYLASQPAKLKTKKASITHNILANN